MSNQYVLAVDFGTSGSRSVVFDLKGNEIASCYRENHITYPEPNSFEYDGQEAYDIITDCKKKGTLNEHVQWSVSRRPEYY